jgi:hypothetical protein
MGEIRKIELGANERHGTQECECPFCLCKCPVCGEQEIEATFRAEWELQNYQTNHISLSRTCDHVVLSCPECGELKDGYIDLINEESNVDLSKLLRFFDQVAGLPSEVHCEIKDGIVKAHHHFS